MPTTKIKNRLYKCLLPFAAPSVRKKPLARVTGHPITHNDLLISIIRRHHMTGTAGLISDGQKKACFFCNSFHTDLVPDENTLFRVASITKIATAMVIFILYDSGSLDLSTPVCDILPDCSDLPELKGVTVQHLLSHTSGLSDPSDMESLLLNSVPFPAAVSGRRIAEPGSSFHYSNLGFGLLGCIIEMVTGMPVGMAFDRFLFTPLGLHASLEACTLPQEQIMPVVRILPWHPDTSLRLTRLGSVPLISPDPLRHYGHSAGSMYIDLLSLEKLISCVRDSGFPLIRNPAAFTLLQEKCSYGKLSPTLSYASGILIIKDSKLSSSRIFGHQGFAYGCVDGAFWEEETGRIMIQLNGGCSEARTGRLGCANADFLYWAFRKEIPSW